jgi:CheY-like chemotaxis protein
LRSSLPATIEIATNIPPDLPLVVADPTQIHQILMNLCTNAAHAMHGAAGRLEVRLEALTTSAEFCQAHAGLVPGRHVRLTVSDSGHGMDETTLQRIFDPFFTTKGPDEGTGLGLSVVHGIVKEHEGAIFVQSQPGRGTQFEVYFPALRENTAPPAAAPARVYAGQQENVLVVDDEPALCHALSRMLTKLGYRPVAFNHPQAALAAFRENPHKFDLVITDLTMPVMTGVDLARELLAVRPELPIILASGFSGACAPEDVHSAGFRDLLAKPFEIPQMSAVIRRALGKTEPKA